ncbi:MAG: S24/S26 family peptidase [Oscillospiraceae bacterium]|nr:S24/S26 family peptidase [Oscillospiraceae bacterium]
MDQEKVDIEHILDQGHDVQIKPQGYSMYPLIIPERDEAIVSSASDVQLKKGDVALYRREGSILVLHRICKIKEDGFYMVGDNQSEVEGPLKREQIKGVLTGFIRNGKYISVRHPVYLLLSRLWLLLRPVRPFIAKSVHALKSLFIK